MLQHLALNTTGNKRQAEQQALCALGIVTFSARIRSPSGKDAFECGKWKRCRNLASDMVH